MSTSTMTSAWPFGRDPACQWGASHLGGDVKTSFGEMEQVDSGICSLSDEDMARMRNLSLHCGEVERCEYGEMSLPEDTDEDGDNLLHLAIIHEARHVAHELLRRDLQRRLLNATNHLMQTPLHLAIVTNQEELAAALATVGADIEAQDLAGNSPLHLACTLGAHGCLRVVTSAQNPRVLTRALCTPNYEGLTCLHTAVLRRDKEMVEYLLRIGANANDEDPRSGRTVLHAAVEMQDEGICETLVWHKANPNAAAWDGCTPLHVAAGLGHGKLAALLSRLGANQKARNLEGETPLDLARHNPSVLTMLQFDDIRIDGELLH
ncbi:unnamed protein product [Lampetra fluviatilis]